MTLIVGLMMGMIATVVGLEPIWIIIGFGAGAALLHVKSSRMLTGCLDIRKQSADTEADSGVGLRQAVSAPLFALALGFLAKACGVAAAWGILDATGIVGTL